MLLYTIENFKIKYQIVSKTFCSSLIQNKNTSWYKIQYYLKIEPQI